MQSYGISSYDYYSSLIVLDDGKTSYDDFHIFVISRIYDDFPSCVTFHHMMTFHDHEMCLVLKGTFINVQYICFTFGQISANMYNFML